MAFTKVVGAGIHTLSNITSHNINSSGIITATKFVGPIEGNITAVDGVFTGNVSIAKTLTYEDVKNVDSVGVGTFREGIFIPNEKKAEFGGASGTRLEIYHSSSDSNNSFIKHTSSGALKIAADHFRFRNAADSSNLFNGLAGGAITLYYSGQEKLSTTSDGIEIPDAIRHLNDTNTAIRFPGNDKISFQTAGLDRLRIEPDGVVLIGHNTSRSVGYEHLVQLESTNSTPHSFSMVANRSSQYGANFDMAKSRSSSVGGSTIVQDDDILSQIISRGADGTDVATVSTIIRTSVDGTPASNDIPGRIEFHTSTGGTSYERLRIDSNGRVLIGTTTPTSLADELVVATSGDCGITIMSGTTHNGRLYFSDSGQEGDGFVDYDHQFGNLKLGTRDITRFTIDSSGRTLLGTGTVGHDNADDLTIATTGHTGISIRSATNRNGSVFFSDGTSGADEYRGWIQYTHTSDYLTFGTNATEKLRITHDSKVGINVTNPQAFLDIGGNSDGDVKASFTRANDPNFRIQFRNESSSNNVGASQGKFGLFYASNSADICGMQFHRGSSTGAGTLSFTTGGTERLRINSSGSVAIGTDSPTGNALTLGGTAAAVICQNPNSGYGANQGFYFGNGNGTIGYVWNYENDQIRFATNNTERLRITSTGLIRMGNGAEGNTEAHITAAIFQNVTGTATILKLGNTNTPSSANNRAIEFCDGTGGTEGSSKYTYAKIKAERVSGSNDGQLIFYTKPDNSSNPTERLRITSSGDTELRNTVSVITNSYSQYLKFRTTQTNGQSAVTGQISGQGKSGWGGDLVFYSKPANGTPNDTLTERFRIANDGNVGINSASPSTRLDVIHQGGGGTAYDVLTLGGAGHGNNTFPKIRFRTTTNSNTLGRIGIYDAGAQTSYSGDFVVELNTGGSPTNTTYEKFRVTGDGKVGINDSDPERTMDIRGSNCMIQLEGTAGSGRQWSLCSTDNATGTSVDGGPSGSFVIYDDTDSTRRFRIQSGGSTDVNVSGGSFKAEGTGAYGISIHNTNSPSMGHLFIYGDNGLIRFRNNSNTYTAQMGYTESNNSLFFANQEGGTTMYINSDGVQLFDNNKFLCGNDKDLEIFHNNSHGFINNDTGHLYLQTAGNSRVQVSTDGSCYFGPQIITEADMGWGHDAHQRPFIFSGNQAGVNPADATIVAANPNTDPSNTRLGGFMFGCKSSGAGNSGIKAYIEGYTTSNPSTAYQSGGYMRFVSRASGGNLTELVRLNASVSGGVDIFGESAYNDSSSGARGVDLSYSGSASVPIYFGTEHNTAQKGMYMYGYWMYIRGHQNEGIRFIFSQGHPNAPRSDQYQFKYNSAYRPGSSQTWDGFSDARAKENVQTLTNGIETIKKLRPVTYDWTDDFADSQTMYIMGRDENGGTVAKKENGYDTDRKNGQYGFIAQEYETVLPKDVKQDKFTLGDTEISDFKTINHDCLIPTLTAALKEAVAKIEVLEAKVAALEGS